MHGIISHSRQSTICNYKPSSGTPSLVNVQSKYLPILIDPTSAVKDINHSPKIHKQLVAAIS